MKFKNIVICTGAGISAESGIKTFRDNNGLWENHRVEEVATPEAFRNNPMLVHKFYNLRRNDLAAVNPNLAHAAITDFQKKYPGVLKIITQNVDDLHERSGSQNVIHMHGELLKSRCVVCEEIKPILSDLSTETICQNCLKQGSIRPHIVWFGELPLFMDEIEDLIANADIFINIGSSGLVYPAAMFVKMAKHNGKCLTFEVNKEKTSISYLFDSIYTGDATSKVPEILSDIENHKIVS